MIQSLSVKICGFVEFVCCISKGRQKEGQDYYRHLHSEVVIIDVEILRAGGEYHVPEKALLASILMFAAFSLFSSVSSARVSLRSSGEGIEGGGVDSPPAKGVSESLIVSRRTQASARQRVEDLRLISGRSQETRGE